MVSHQPLTVVGPEGFKGCSGCHKMGEKSAEELNRLNSAMVQEVATPAIPATAFP